MSYKPERALTLFVCAADSSVSSSRNELQAREGIDTNNNSPAAIAIIV